MLADSPRALDPRASFGVRRSKFDFTELYVAMRVHRLSLGCGGVMIRTHDPMRICAIGLRGIPNVMGGIETHCENLYPAMMQLDDHIDVVVIGRSAYARAGRFHGVGVKTVWAPRSKCLETLVHTPLALLHARLSIQPDLVHLHGVGPGFFTPLARLLGFRVVATHHAADYDRPKWGIFGRTYLKAGEFLLGRFAHQVVCVNDELTGKIVRGRQRRRRRVHTIRNGAPPPPSMNAADPQLFARLGLTEGKFILAVGRIEPTKGFHDLIDAFNAAAPADYKLVIVGAAHTESAYCRRVMQKQSERVIFAGFQNAATLRLLYAKAGLFVLPSYMEGSPLVALEAMSAGAPLLLSDISAHREFRLEPHLYFAAGDVAALGAALARGDYAAYRSRRAAALLRENDWREIARKHLAVYRLCCPDYRVEDAPAVA